MPKWLSSSASLQRQSVSYSQRRGKTKIVANKGVFVPIVVVKRGPLWLTIDTATHKIRGHHATRAKAVAQRRILESLRRKERK